MAAHYALDVGIEVLILAPQQKRLPKRESSLLHASNFHLPYFCLNSSAAAFNFFAFA